MLEQIINLAEDTEVAKVISEKASNPLEALGLGGSVTLLGVAIVFLALVSLILITWLYPKIVKYLIGKFSVIKENNKAKKAAKKANKAAEKLISESDTKLKAEQTSVAAKTSGVDDKELIAVITAAIAASLGTSSNGIIIKSLRRSGASIPSWGLEGRNEQVYNRF